MWSRLTAVFVLFLVLLMPSMSAAAQSLGELARKERERREKNRDRGVAVHEYSEDEIFEDEDETDEADPEATDGSSNDEASETGDAPSASPVPERIDIAVDADDASGTMDDERRDRRRQEAEWRNRFHEARERVKLAREQKAVWDGVHYVEGITLVDENGNVVVDSLDDLRRYVSEANRELAAAERALSELEEEARRAGVPPGWRR